MIDKMGRFGGNFGGFGAVVGVPRVRNVGIGLPSSQVWMSWDEAEKIDWEGILGWHSIIEASFFFYIEKVRKHDYEIRHSNIFSLRVSFLG